MSWQQILFLYQNLTIISIFKFLNALYYRHHNVLLHILCYACRDHAKKWSLIIRNTLPCWPVKNSIHIMNMPCSGPALSKEVIPEWIQLCPCENASPWSRAKQVKLNKMSSEFTCLRTFLRHSFFLVLRAVFASSFVSSGSFFIESIWCEIMLSFPFYIGP